MDSYSVNVANRFAFFLDEDDDPGDVIMPAPVKKDENTKAAKISKQQGGKIGKGKENKDKAPQQAAKKPIENGSKTGDRPQFSTKGPQRSTGGRERGDNRRERGDRDDRPPRGPRSGRPRLSSKEKDGEGGFPPVGDQGDARVPRSPRERGPRPFRGGRGGNSGPRKREFERRSGNDKSSVKPIEKREGGGAHNWGRQEDVANEEWNNEEEPTQETEPIANGDTTEEPNTEDKVEETPPVDEGPQEMTLEEYRAKNHTGRVRAEVQERKAGENVDHTQWKNTFQLEKQDEEFFSGTREVIEKPKTSGRIKTTIDTTGFFFKDQARRGRGRTPGGPGTGNRGPGRRSGEGEERRAGGRSEDRRERGEDQRGRGEDQRGRGEDQRGRGEDQRGRGEDRRGRGEDRRGRGDDRRGRGERRSFGGGGGRRRDFAPNVEDEKDFPQLGAP